MKTHNKFVVGWLSVAVMAWLGPGLTGVRAADEMEDPCMGEMQWMIGWCMDTASAGNALVTGDLTALARSAACPQHSSEFTSIDVPGAAATRAFGINARGHIVGSYTDRAVPPVTHGYVLRHGVFTTIDYPAATTRATEAWGINSRGDIIGRYTRSDRPGQTLGFLRRHGQFTDISIGDHRHTLPTKIGESGHVVGCFHETSGDVDMYAYVQRRNSLTTFALPSTQGISTMHNGTTRGGRLIVGLTFPAPGLSRGYALSHDTLTYLDFPGSTFTQAWDVTPGRTIVGDYVDAVGSVHGFYHDEDGFVSIDVPGASATRARGIDPQGRVVGVYVDATGPHGFLTKLDDEDDEDDDEDDD